MKIDIVDNAIPAAVEGKIDDTKPMSQGTLAYLVERADLWDETSLRQLIGEVLTEGEWVDVRGYTRPEFFFNDDDRINEMETGLVLLDWETGMDGVEAVRRTLKARPGDGVFIVTGFDSSSRVTQEVTKHFSDSSDRIAVFRKGETSLTFLRMVGKFYDMVEAGIIIAGRQGDVKNAQKEGQDEGELSGVWCATNRCLATEDPVTFGNKREASLRYGRAYVRVMPRTPLPPRWKVIKRFRLNSERTIYSHFDALPKDSFYELIRKENASRHGDDREFLLFIHGFNVSFEEAVESVAQIAYDIRFPGQIGAFIWPSLADQSKNAYLADKEVSLNSSDVLCEFLTDLVNQDGLSRIHIVAHSMGNFLCLQALDRLLGNKAAPFDRKIAQLVLVAPDVETEWFTQHKFSTSAERLTVYSSSQDWALEVSKDYQNVHRLGLIPPVTYLDDCDTVDASVCQTPFRGVGHDYYSQSTRLLADFSLVLQGHPAAKRPFLKRHALEDGHYWELEPTA